jgi:hypothetical protein
VITESFARLPALSQAIHAASIGCSALAVILLMAPAAYHRIVFEGEDAPEMHRVGSILITAATVPLAAGLAGDVYVVVTKIAGNEVGIIAGILTIVVLAGLWYGFPIAARLWGAGIAGRRYSASPAE